MLSICLFVCLFVSKITEKLLNCFFSLTKFEEKWHIGHERTHYILVVIRITVNVIFLTFHVIAANYVTVR